MIKFLCKALRWVPLAAAAFGGAALAAHWHGTRVSHHTMGHTIVAGLIACAIAEVVIYAVTWPVLRKKPQQPARKRSRRQRATGYSYPWQ